MVRIYYNNNDLWNYILDNIDEKKYLKIKVALNNNIIVRVLRKLLGRRIWCLPMMARYIFPRDLYDNLRNADAHDKILVLDRVLPSELWAIAKIVPKECEKILWYWNPLCTTYAGKEIVPMIKFIKSLGYEIYTFDQFDVDNYGLHYHNQVARICRTEENFPIVYDFYFLGRIKDRYNTIKEIESYLNNRGYNNLFIYVSDKSQYISYDTNIRNIRSCRCIIDINQRPQAGITLRPIESLFYKKKLITNNPNIRTIDFYNPNNIFIWGQDDLARLECFIQEPCVDIDEHILSKYDINEWLRVLCAKK